jgi:hypothetical protein
MGEFTDYGDAMPVAQELEVERTCYMVEAFDDKQDLIEAWQTFGSWKIEGDFLITWDEQQLRHAWLLAHNVVYLKTTEWVPRHRDDEDEGSILSEETRSFLDRKTEALKLRSAALAANEAPQGPESNEGDKKEESDAQ